MAHWWNIINKAQGAAVPVSMNNASDDQLKQEEQYIKTLENQIKPLQDKSSAGSISVEERNTLTRLQQRVNEQKQKITQMKSKPQPTQREQITTTLREPQQPAPQQPAPPKNVGPMNPQRATNSGLSAQELQALGLDPTKKPTQDAINAALERKKKIKSAQEVSDKSVKEFRDKQEEQNKKPTARKVEIPKMIDLPPTPQMQAEANKDAMIDRFNRGGRYKVERRKPFDAKKWQKQLQARGQKARLAEQEAQKQKRTASRTAMKDKTLERIKEKARRKQSRDDKASGLTDAGRRFLDNQQRVADEKTELARKLSQKPRQTSRNVTSTGGL